MRAKAVTVLLFAMAVIGGLWAAAWMIVNLVRLVPENAMDVVVLGGTGIGLLELAVFFFLAVVARGVIDSC